MENLAKGNLLLVERDVELCQRRPLVVFAAVFKGFVDVLYHLKRVAANLIDVSQRDEGAETTVVVVGLLRFFVHPACYAKGDVGLVALQHDVDAVGIEVVDAVAAF